MQRFSHGNGLVHCSGETDQRTYWALLVLVVTRTCYEFRASTATPRYYIGCIYRRPILQITLTNSSSEHSARKNSLKTFGRLWNLAKLIWNYREQTFQTEETLRRVFLVKAFFQNQLKLGTDLTDSSWDVGLANVRWWKKLVNPFVSRKHIFVGEQFSAKVCWKI